MATLVCIKFRDTNESNEYTCPYNPSEWSDLYDDEINIEPSIDGAAVRMKSVQDSRIRTLKWDANKDSNTTFKGMLSELLAYKGDLKQIHFGTIDYRSLGWTNIRVHNVKVDILRGGALRYNIILEYEYV